MSASALLADLGRCGIRLEANGGRLRYFPRSALTPDLLNRLTTHKADLLSILRAPALPKAAQATRRSTVESHIESTMRPVVSVLERFPIFANRGEASGFRCRCGGTTSCDLPIHEGQSVRRDCGRCGRFLDFPVWYGKSAGRIGQ
jgi:hypothetical protein